MYIAFGQVKQQSYHSTTARIICFSIPVRHTVYQLPEVVYM